MLRTKDNKCIMNDETDKRGRHMIEVQVLNQGYLCRTKDLFWYKEVRQTISLIIEKRKTLDDIKRFSEEGNFYNAASKSRANEIRTAVARRISAVNGAFLQFFMSQDVESQKLLCIVMVMLTDRMFLEFMEFVYREKLITGDLELNDGDVIGYIHSIQEKGEHAARWTDAGVKKIRNNYKAILKEAGLLSDHGAKRKIFRPIVSQELYHFLAKEGLERIGQILTGERR